ncbi:hypothetical protein [Limosilactobacillus mucosae]|uniref:hypothetical protein n=1 Tax=Limosilactobacillus mucosae TaxID=97478 RepID=UPI000FFB2FAE|nr:hypothetical protein [Limosilactobacillus mucosae]RXA58154.1 hypothetical protein EQ839_02900 [Limosilactobacillus mucosae]
MSTRRARKHKGLVESEKMLHHLPGDYHQSSKIRCVNLERAEAAESAYEWHKREKRRPELAQELNELFDWMFRK